ncbi:MAG: glutamine synthetase type III, partial [Desulfovibrionaceae bacterium]|nr:glutamine synthetase type III [Desulfovibrionaceae bacterium]
VVRAVHQHSEVLRLGTIGAGNDHRLGANEAPPAILSIYLGEQLTKVIEQIMHKGKEASQDKPKMEIGVSTLPPLPLDLSDRNRTSPFAFTGNKFEFRAVGSSQSIAPANIALNAAVACALDDIATELEANLAQGISLNQALQELLPRLFKEHQAVIFNGNGYTEAWKEEAEKRGLPNYNNTVDALLHYMDPKVKEVFLRHKILNEPEMLSRQEILLENYINTISIEAKVLLDMVRTKILPPAKKAEGQAAKTLYYLKQVGQLDIKMELDTFKALQSEIYALTEAVKTLELNLLKTLEAPSCKEQAILARDMLLSEMEAVRSHADNLESMLDDSLWQLPKYKELLWLH